MTTSVPSPAVASQFIEVDGRQVYLRFAGQGPALLLLHQSPQSSRAMVPWIERLAGEFAVFAPDTPGFGHSDPLPLAAPEIPDYAAALAALLGRLGIGPVVVYGVHTGAVTALRLALDHPRLVAGLVCDGYARFDQTEREALLAHYLPPFEPSWDGTHLMWLYARLREQHLFFPWHEPTAAARMAYPVPSPEHVHSTVMDVLDAGDGYRVGYRAPFLYDDVTAAARLTVPAHIYYRAEDVLAPHLARLPRLPLPVSAEIVDGGATALVEKAVAAFRRFAAQATTCDSGRLVAAATANAGAARAIVETAPGPLALRRVEGRGVDSLLVLHDFGQPARVPAIRDQYRQVLVPDLPGHGASRDWLPAHCQPDVTAAALRAVLDVVGADAVVIEAEGGSCAAAAALAGLLGARCRGLRLHNPLVLDAVERDAFLALLPPPGVVTGGGHLAAVWQWARLRYLFWPWLPQDGKAARKVAAPAPRRVHADAVEILRAGACFPALWRGAFEFDMAAALAPLACPLTLRASADAEPSRLTARLATTLKLPPSSPIAGDNIWRRGA